MPPLSGKRALLRRWARPFDYQPDAPLIRPSASDAAAFGILGPQLPGGDDRARRSLGRAVEALNHSMQATRRLIFGLRPPLLDTQGLVAVINQQLSKVSVGTGVQTDLRWRGDERLDAALEATAFRAVQEALANVVQHANATRLLVTGQVADGLLAMEVVDDASGFTPDPQPQAMGDGHLGIPTMSERNDSSLEARAKLVRCRRGHHPFSRRGGSPGTASGAEMAEFAAALGSPTQVAWSCSR